MRARTLRESRGYKHHTWDPSVNAGDKRDAGSIPGSGRSPRAGHATHSSILAWRIPWTEGSGGLQCVGSQRVGQDRSDLARAHANLTSDLVLVTCALEDWLIHNILTRKKKTPSRPDFQTAEEPQPRKPEALQLAPPCWPVIYKGAGGLGGWGSGLRNCNSQNAPRSFRFPARGPEWVFTPAALRPGSFRGTGEGAGSRAARDRPVVTS